MMTRFRAGLTFLCQFTRVSARASSQSLYSTFRSGLPVLGLAMFAWSSMAVAQSYTVVDLGALSTRGDRASDARGLNDKGQVVGNSRKSLSAFDRRAFLWDSSAGMKDLGFWRDGNKTSEAFDINNRGQIVGRSDASKGSLAILWDSSGSMQELGGGLGAFAINNKGQVVGQVGERAFLWDKAGGMKDLGVLRAGDDVSEAWAINK